MKNMKELVETKQVPIFVIPATELGKVPLDALSVSDERSVGARLESLETSVQSVISAVEKLTAVRSPAVPVPSVSMCLSHLQPLLMLLLGYFSLVIPQPV